MSIDSARTPESANTESANTGPNRLSSAQRQRPAIRRLGPASLALAALLTGVEAIAIAVGSTGHWLTATALAWLVIVLTVVSFGGGLVAVIRDHGRRWGIAAAALSLIANPLVLVWLFGALGGGR
jgi:hypothetical protein